MGRSGYTSLSIEEKRYAKLRRTYDTTHTKDESFTVWAANALDSYLTREDQVNWLYPGIKYIGNKTGGVILEEKGNIIEISVGKSSLTCSQDKGVCKHVLFAVLHPEFEL